MVGLALAAEWFPQEASRWVANEELLIDYAFENVVPPPGTAEPEDPLAAVPGRLQQPAARILRNALSRFLEANKNPCLEASAKVGVDVIKLIFAILGVNFDGDVLAEIIVDSISASGAVIDAIVAVVEYMDNAPTALEVAYGVAEIFTALYEEGIFSKVLWKAVSDMSWWDISLLVIRVAATVASWFVTQGVATAIQIGLVGIGTIDLVTDIIDASTKCSNQTYILP
jgi:hypothetical protein